MKIQFLVHNQPFMLKPQEDKINLESAKIKDKKKNDERINELKEKISILIEGPLFMNGDLLSNEMFCEPD